MASRGWTFGAECVEEGMSTCDSSACTIEARCPEVRAACAEREVRAEGGSDEDDAVASDAHRALGVDVMVARRRRARGAETLGKRRVAAASSRDWSERGRDGGRRWTRRGRHACLRGGYLDAQRGRAVRAGAQRLLARRAGAGPV
ncbi:hypothetical protein FGB62_44g010 [Gracilaria domingensis]|nr:hypothetical protein FGB62_44g010 [Gracilaria domingensis]